MTVSVRCVLCFQGVRGIIPVYACDDFATLGIVRYGLQITTYESNGKKPFFIPITKNGPTVKT